MYKKLSLGLLFIILALNVHATVCNVTNTSLLVIENPRPYQDINVPFTFYAYYTDNASIPINADNVTVTFQNNTYGMSYNGGKWGVTITSNTTEDISFIINATSENYTCKIKTFTTKFRTPYYVTFKLYKKPLNDTNPTPYLNDFQYVVLVNKNDKRTIDVSSMALLNGMTSIIGGWNDAVGLPTAKSTGLPDNIVYVWGSYSMGQATVKVYEPANYSIYVMSNKVQYSNSHFWEFQKPTDDNPSFLGIALSNIALYNSSNVSDTARAYNNTVVSISMTPFETNAYYAIMNWLKIIIVIIVYFGVVILSVYLFGSSPNGWKAIIGVAVAGAAMALGIIWGLG